MLLSWHRREQFIYPMCHAFPSPFALLPPFLHPSLSASGSYYHPYSLHFYACTFLLLHFHPACLLNCIPSSLIFRPCFSLLPRISLLGCYFTQPLFNPPFHLLLILFVAMSVSHNYNPTFHGKVPQLFPSFEAFFPNSSSQSPSCTNNSTINDQRVKET